MEAPDISTIPVSDEQYANELQKLTREQLQNLSHPQVLDNDQKELMGLHYKMNHLPLPLMITLAEKGKLNRKFAKLKHRLPVCMSCMFGTAQQSRPTPVLQRNSNHHDGPQDLNHACLSSLSSTQLALDGTLPPRILIQNMSIFPLWPK